ncbi:hypothetical protein EUX98_g923 [Antrodiella citrinella]|uniref:Fungal-type protein kinase domain-containing protein n=1 Tax=Antrodiella citrinella TaxID=2447956 RepID=A0A4S4N5Q4_9APHY|nr:hypothetical protein EUX98_g923 [Antrodiella citrinella]
MSASYSASLPPTFYYPAVGCSRWQYFPSTMSQERAATAALHENFSDEELDRVPPMINRKRRWPVSDSPTHPHQPPLLPAKAVSEATRPTPLRGSMEWSTRSTTGYVDPDVKAYLRHHFRGSVVRHYDVAKFLRQVWHFNINSLGLEDGTEFHIDPSHFDNFLRGTWSKEPLTGNATRMEGNAAIAFHQIWEDISSQFPAGSQHQPMFFLNMKDRTVRGTYTKYKPDFGFSAMENIKMQHWDYLADCGEMKKLRVLQIIDRIKYQYRLTINALRLQQVFGPNKKRKRLIMRTRTSDDEEADSEDNDDADDDDDDDPDYTPGPSKRPRTTRKIPTLSHVPEAATYTLDPSLWDEADDASELTGPELQIAKYLNELLSHGVRTYATGFLLQDTTMSLWYADRMGLVQSEPFNVETQPHLLLLMVAAHHYGTPHDFGLNPLLSLPPDTHHLTSYHNMTLTLPTATSAILPPPDATSETNTVFDEGTGDALGSLQFQVDLDGNREINTAYGTVSRGTTIIPVVATQGTPSAAYWGASRLVAKFACPLETRQAEDRFIRVIRRKLNTDSKARQFLKNIVDLKCSFSCKMEDECMRLPRAMMRRVADDVRRSFRVLVMPEYLPMERISSPHELQRIFIDVVTGHHWVFETSHILHRDISYGNIMFYREEHEGEERVIGVLTDWDLAEKQEEDGTQIKEDERHRKPIIAQPSGFSSSSLTSLTSSDTQGGKEQMGGPEAEQEGGKSKGKGRKRKRGRKGKGKAQEPEPASEPIDEDALQQEARKRQRAKYRTGTGPFMAWDLLQGGATPIHLYRHDLESFFWVLAWFLAVFDPKEHKLGIVPDWHQSSLLNVGAAKGSFLQDRDVFNRVFAKTDPAYRPLTTSHLKWLRIYICRAKNLCNLEAAASAAYFEMLDQGSDADVENPYWDDMLAKTRKDLIMARTELRDLVTFDMFMAAINMPLPA